jgi:Neuraminidase (sialidase)
MALTVPLSWLTDATNTQEVPGVNDWGDIENTIRLQGLRLSHKLQKTATPLPMI